jgi:hypothetical protein
MNRVVLGVAIALASGASMAGAQSSGAIAGRVTEVSGQGIAGATISVDGGRQGASTDTAGYYRVRVVRSGWHRASASGPSCMTACSCGAGKRSR